jgi:plastocyanin domain-containing protein
MTLRTPLAVIFIVVAIGVLATGCASNAPQNDKSITPSGQSIALISDENGQYRPDTIRVKAGSIVRIEGDTETLVGGMDTVVIDGYGIRKTIAPGDNVIEFVADKPGTYEMICANGMGNGQLIVE